MANIIKRYALGLLAFKSRFVDPQDKDKYGAWGRGTSVGLPCIVNGRQNIYLGDNVGIGPDSILFAPKGKITIKKCSYSGPRLYVGTGNHLVKPGYFSKFIDLKTKHEIGGKDLDWDVTIEEDVWMGENVSILCKHVGRGAIIAAGSVVTKNVPPYTTVGGVPAKFIKFHFTKEEILFHESQLYPEDERMSEEEIDEMFASFQLS